MSKLALQISTGLLAAIPVVTGLIGLAGLRDPIYASARLPTDTMLDSNLRFLGGVWLGTGFTLYWLIPKIDQQTALFRAIWTMIFLGGVGRLISMFLIGLPPTPFIAFTILEIVGAPIFVVWQAGLKE
jgi:hypothetical protein